MWDCRCCFPLQPKNWHSRLFIWSCFFASTYCTYFFYLHASLSCSCFVVSNYCTYLILYVLCWLFPPLYLLMFFWTYLLYILILRTYCTCSVDRSRLFIFICSCFFIYLLYILILRTYCKCFVDRSRLFICSCFLYPPTVLCRNVFSFWELFPTTTKKLTQPHNCIVH